MSVIPEGPAADAVRDDGGDRAAAREPEDGEASRWVPLTGVDNTRDLGGLPVEGGGVTRRGVAFRSSTPQSVTGEDVGLLLDGLGLRTVVDLRGPGEAVREGHGLLADGPVHRANLPVRLPERDFTGVVPAAPPGSTADFYLTLLRASGDTLTEVARIVADPDRHAVLFHCAVGKDRTGVCAAVLLDAVGVTAEAITADYALTAQRVHRVRKRLTETTGYQGIPAADHPYMASAPETMRAFLARLRDGYGGGAGWLLRHGLTEDEVEALRAALVTR
ncbi:tyrosine-protein phosphatase [Streptomyces sp. JNUCC 64]